MPNVPVFDAAPDVHTGYVELSTKLPYDWHSFRQLGGVEDQLAGHDADRRYLLGQVVNGGDEGYETSTTGLVANRAWAVPFFVAKRIRLVEVCHWVQGIGVVVGTPKIKHGIYTSLSTILYPGTKLAEVDINTDANERKDGAIGVNLDPGLYWNVSIVNADHIATGAQIAQVRARSMWGLGWHVFPTSASSPRLFFAWHNDIGSFTLATTFPTSGATGRDHQTIGANAPTPSAFARFGVVA